ncbi:peptide chain release factor N(5)-glutamine methyltransferase [Rhodoferax aquaticus]|uniref:Release factor glutamine methyltransferase n=1 Tax=Rhodoferax aquaticus TaxID=2527691 RepID=A0A515EM44_9BURK|nr:peptide chain release factor N(5)-glutamine methyltransferase [Rhodoferax aquaticus]QDL53728.1 peptide chain release factor N(5)-glutamine methyltransferase [Rhodoferax aquaticus]
MTIAQALQHCIALGLDRLDAQLLLLHLLGRAPHDRAWLLAHDADTLPPTQWATLEAAALRRVAGEPIAYLVGHKEFYGLNLELTADVLVPRPDTETLVEWALELLEPTPDVRVVDLGTGSGAIALALKATRPALQVEAVDFSHAALAVAQANAKRLKLEVAFSQGSWLSGTQGRFQVIVSNPPYIREDDEHMPALRFEPRQALTAGADGLDDIRAIIQQAPDRLLAGGWLLLEHGYDQAADVRGLLAAAGFCDVQSRRDLAGIERCSGGRWPALIS